jgi:hypothetical protein
MLVRAKGRAVLNAKVKAIEKELSSVAHSIRTLSETVHDSVDAGAILRARQHAAEAMGMTKGGRRKPAPTFVGRDSDEAIKKMGRRIHDERFSQYLSSSFKPTRSLKHEKSVQRNKAIVMSCVVLVIFVWGLFRFLF